MTEFQKIYAPRPVKANSNLKCLKCKSPTGNLSNIDVIEKSFPLFDNKHTLSKSHFSHFNHKARKIKSPTTKNHKFLLNDETFEHFCEEVKKDFKVSKLEEDESDIKEEIFSILKFQNSTKVIGFCLQNYFLNCQTEEGCSKYSTLPERSKNPVYKNFEMESRKKSTKYFSEMNTNEITLENYFFDDVDEFINIDNSKE